MHTTNVLVLRVLNAIFDQSRGRSRGCVCPGHGVVGRCICRHRRTASPSDIGPTPYLIRSDLFYKVERTDDHGEGRPTILHMQDRTGDGKPFEFALYDAVFCMGLETALIGYSEKRDGIVQYPVDLTIEHAGSRTTVSRLWTDYLFHEQPISPGYWHFQVDYRGRGGCLDTYDVRYVPTTERFAGTLRQTDCSP